MVRVYPSGDILLSRRVTLTLRCPMDLSNFPFDTQVCSLYVTSWGHTRSLIDYHWNNSQPIQLNRETPIPDFELRQYHTEQCHKRTATGEYSCIQVDFTLKRNWRHYLIQVVDFFPLMLRAAFVRPELVAEGSDSTLYKVERYLLSSSIIGLCGCARVCYHGNHFIICIIFLSYLFSTGNRLILSLTSSLFYWKLLILSPISSLFQ